MTIQDDLALLHKYHLAKQGFDQVRKLGQGAFSCVYQITRNDQTCAVKIIEQRDLPKKLDCSSISLSLKQPILKENTFVQLLPRSEQQFESNHTLNFNHIVKKIIYNSSPCQPSREYFRREIHALSLLSSHFHPNVIRIFKIQRTLLGAYVFMEHVPGGTVQNYLLQHSFIQECPLAARWTRQTCSALNYLHNELGLAHRDVKLENLGLTSSLSIKLLDFGFACNCRIRRNFKQNFIEFTLRYNSECGTPIYMAPEVHTAARCPYDPRKADLWSLGVCVFVMISGRYPFGIGNTEDFYRKKILKNWIQEQVFTCFSNCSWQWIQKMLEPFPSKRINALEALNASWLRQDIK